MTLVASGRCCCQGRGGAGCTLNSVQLASSSLLFHAMGHSCVSQNVSKYIVSNSYVFLYVHACVHKCVRVCFYVSVFAHTCYTKLLTAANYNEKNKCSGREHGLGELAFGDTTLLWEFYKTHDRLR